MRFISFFRLLGLLITILGASFITWANQEASDPIIGLIWTIVGSVLCLSGLVVALFPYQSALRGIR